MFNFDLMNLLTTDKTFDISRNVAMGILILTLLGSLYVHKNILTQEIQGAHSWRQCQTMWNIRNFVRHDSNILNPRVSHFNGGKDNIYRYEFPIMQWTIAQIEKITSEDIFVVRIFLFLLGAIGVLGMYYLANQIFNNKIVAVLTAHFFQYSPLFYYYGLNPIPDNLALVASIWYLYFILVFNKSKSQLHLIFAVCLLLLASLSKLPYLMFGVVSFYIFIVDLIKTNPNFKKIMIFGLIHAIILIPTFMWYAWVIPGWKGNTVLSGIFEYQLDFHEYKEIFKYHITQMFPRILLYPTVWPLMAIGLIGIWFQKVNKGWLIGLVSITFLFLFLEFNAINIVHDYYLMPFLPWLYVIIGSGIAVLLKLKKPIFLIVFGFLFFYASNNTTKSTDSKWTNKHDAFNPDVYKYQKELKEVVPRDELCLILNDESTYIFSYLIDKMGHVVHSDNLNIGWIGDMIDNYGLTYMYSDSRKIDQNPEIAPFIDTLLLSAGSINVYKLRDPISKDIKHLPFFKQIKKEN